MGSSAQNSSGVDWCRRQVQRGSEKVPKVPGGFGAERSGSTGFQSSGEGLGGFGAEPGQVQQGSEEGSGEGSGEGLGGFGAEPGQFQQGFGEVSGEGSGRLWCRARAGSTGFRWRFRWRFGRLLVESHVRFNGFRRRLRKRRFWESLVQGQVRFHRFSRGFPALGFAAHGSERSFFRIIMRIRYWHKSSCDKLWHTYEK